MYVGVDHGCAWSELPESEIHLNISIIVIHKCNVFNTDGGHFFVHFSHNTYFTHVSFGSRTLLEMEYFYIVVLLLPPSFVSVYIY